MKALLILLLVVAFAQGIRYDFITKTGDDVNAGTQFPPLLYLYGPGGTSGRVQLNDSLKSSQTQTFVIQTRDVGTLQEMWLQPSTGNDNLRLLWIKIYDRARNIWYHFMGSPGLPVVWQWFIHPEIRRGIPTTMAPTTTPPPPPVVMCHYHQKYKFINGERQVRKMPLQRISEFPCTHIVYGKDAMSMSFILNLVYLHTPHVDRRVIKFNNRNRIKALFSLKIKYWPSQPDRTMMSLRYELRFYRYDGIEIDAGHSQYRKFSNKTALSNLIKVFREGFNEEARESGQTRLELSVVVNSAIDMRRHYDIDFLSTYADYVVVNAVVSEWPNPSPYSPYDLSTVSPSSLHNANTGGEAQSEAVAKWVEAGLPRDKIILPFTTFAWNPPYCVNPRMTRDQCDEFYDLSFIHIEHQMKPTIVHKIPYLGLCNPHKHYMDRAPYDQMQTGPGVPFENEHTVRERTNYVKAQHLRGTKVLWLQFDDFDNLCGGGRLPLTTLAYRELVDPQYGQSVSHFNGGSGAGTAGLSAVLTTVIICVHLSAGL